MSAVTVCARPGCVSAASHGGLCFAHGIRPIAGTEGKSWRAERPAPVWNWATERTAEPEPDVEPEPEWTLFDAAVDE
jgi:hypothetical protein